MKIGVLFSGQGAQYPGMMKDLYDTEPAARDVFDCANRVLGREISALCFEGTQDELNLTHNTQPCMLAGDIAAGMILRSHGVRADAAAGSSFAVAAVSFAAAGDAAGSAETGASADSAFAVATDSFAAAGDAAGIAVDSSDMFAAASSSVACSAAGSSFSFSTAGASLVLFAVDSSVPTGSFVSSTTASVSDSSTSCSSWVVPA